MDPGSDPSKKFDAYAGSYEDLLAKSVTASGEEQAYFFEYKRRCIERLVGGGFSEPILDYGCGVGMLLQQLSHVFPVAEGFDPSGESVALARARVPAAELYDDASKLPAGRYGLAVLSCVLHHVPPPDRGALLRRIARLLKPGGRLVVFEHNPLNPLTRRAVAMCPFDDDAILLYAGEAKRLLEGAGFSSVRRDYIVFFPRALRRLRWIEPHLRAVPLGAQVMLVASA